MDWNYAMHKVPTYINQGLSNPCKGWIGQMYERKIHYVLRINERSRLPNVLRNGTGKDQKKDKMV